MNPELKTSLSLPRNISIQKQYVKLNDNMKRVNTCHTQLNQRNNISWRFRNNYVHTHSNMKARKKIIRPTFSKQLRQTLYSNISGSEMTKSMINTLKTQMKEIDKTPKLVKGITELKKMNLLLSKELKKVRYNVKNNKTIYNDYHQLKTNGGYGRSYCGRLYTS